MPKGQSKNFNLPCSKKQLKIYQRNKVRSFHFLLQSKVNNLKLKYLILKDKIKFKFTEKNNIIYQR